MKALIGINNISDYTRAEIVGRDKAQALFGSKQQLVDVEERSAPFDLSGSTLAGNFYIEVKDRQCKSDAYDDGDILEYTKLKNMMNVEPNAKHYYVCFFSDNVCRVYHLNEIKIQDVFIANRLCPSSSVEDKGDKYKLVYELPTALAKTYKY